MTWPLGACPGEVQSKGQGNKWTFPNWDKPVHANAVMETIMNERIKELIGKKYVVCLLGDDSTLPGPFDSTIIDREDLVPAKMRSMMTVIDSDVQKMSKAGVKVPKVYLPQYMLALEYTGTWKLDQDLLPSACVNWSRTQHGSSGALMCMLAARYCFQSKEPLPEHLMETWFVMPADFKQELVNLRACLYEPPNSVDMANVDQRRVRAGWTDSIVGGMALSNFRVHNIDAFLAVIDTYYKSVVKESCTPSNKYGRIVPVPVEWLPVRWRAAISQALQEALGKDAWEDLQTACKKHWTIEVPRALNRIKATEREKKKRCISP